MFASFDPGAGLKAPLNHCCTLAVTAAGQLPDPEGRIGAINIPVDSLALDREDMPIPFSVEQQGDSR